MDKTNVTKNEQTEKDLPNSIGGYTVEHLEDKKVNVFFSDDEIEMIVGHELKKEYNYGNASEH